MGSLEKKRLERCEDQTENHHEESDGYFISTLEMLLETFYLEKITIITMDTTCPIPTPYY